MHPLAISALLAALPLAIRRRDVALSASLALWAGSDVALSALRGPLDEGLYTDGWRYPLTMGLWLMGPASGAALGCWRLLRMPLLGLLPIGFVMGQAGTLAAMPWMGRAAGVMTGWAMWACAVGCCAWAIVRRRFSEEERRALVVCGIDVCAVLSEWPVKWTWVQSAQGAICGALLVLMMWKGRRE